MFLSDGTQVEFRPNVHAEDSFCVRCRGPLAFRSGVVAVLTTWQGQQLRQILDDDCAFSFYGYRRPQGGPLTIDNSWS